MDPPALYFSSSIHSIASAEDYDDEDDDKEDHLAKEDIPTTSFTANAPPKTEAHLCELESLKDQLAKREKEIAELKIFHGKEIEDLNALHYKDIKKMRNYLNCKLQMKVSYAAREMHH